MFGCYATGKNVLPKVMSKLFEASHFNETTRSN